jgi:osmotically-inducible protein OsmY
MIKKSSQVPFLTLLIGAGMLATVQITASNLDNRIELSVRQSAIFRNHLQKDDIQITSRNGVVRLTGTVIDESHITLASKTIASLPGVVEVINQLAEQSDGSTETTSEWLAEDAHATLSFNRKGSAGEITVRGPNGSVRLDNTAGMFTSDVRGIETVTGNITLAYEENAIQ